MTGPAEIDGHPVLCRCGQPARGDRAATSPATGSLDHWCRQCSVEHCELDRYLRDNVSTCPDCGHRHAGPALAGICVGCPCAVRA